jgi:hypothetical protein
LRAELGTGLHKWEDAFLKPVLGWNFPLRIQYELADSLEEFGREIQQTTLVGIERVIAPGEPSFDFVDELWNIVLIALLK